MIVTFTANPSVDRTAEVERLRRGAVMRPVAVRIDGGGKGVNVTRALHSNGVQSLAVLPVGGSEGAQLEGLLAAAELQTRTVRISGAVRANVTIAEADGTTTKLNEPGPTLSGPETEALGATLVQAAAGAEWAVLAGSLPPGAPPNLYADLTRRLHAVGVRVALDTDGPLLLASLAAGPDLVKPNRRELAEATGLRVETPQDAVVAIRRLQAAGARAVLASLGSAGAVLADNTGAYHATAPVASPRSTVGAGDALLAGFLAAGACGPDALAEAVAWGTAAVTLPGSRMPTPTDINRDGVLVTPLQVEEVPPLTAIVTPDLVDLRLPPVDRGKATRLLATRLAQTGRVTDVDGFLADVARREAQMPTGLEGGIGLPHARSPHVSVPSLAFGRSAEGIDFGADDGPAHLIFLIAAPSDGDADHMTILAALARRLVHASFREALLQAPDPATAAAVITREVEGS